MDEFIIARESLIRLTCFLMVLAVMIVVQFTFPKRQLTQPLKTRWVANFGMVITGTALMRLTLPIAAIGTAQLCSEKGWGFLNQFHLPLWISVTIAFTVLDLFIYLQHRAFHAVPILWRLHRMHHSDLDIDVTTGLRFHPFEFFLSALLKSAVILALGAPVLAVVLFEIALNATSLFNHSNLDLNARLDRLLRRIVVTPDMHRIHHSSNPIETNSNFGFNLPWWDHLLGTYRKNPQIEHEYMEIGLKEFRDPKRLTFARLVAQPFLRNGL